MTQGAETAVEVVQLRSMVVGSVFALLGALAGGLIMLGHSLAPPAFGWLLFGLGACCLLLLWLSYRWRHPAQAERLRQVAMAQTVVAAVLVLAMVAFSAWGLQGDAAVEGAFRPTYAFVPLLYLVCALLLPSSQAMHWCWTLFVIQTVIIVTGSWHHDALLMQRDGEPALMLWLFAGHPMFLILISSLSGYRERVGELAPQTALVAELNRSQERFRLVLRGLQVGAWGRHISNDGRWYSERFHELLGYDAPPRTPITIRGLLHPQDFLRYADGVTEGLSRGDDFNIDARLRMAGGDYRWFNIRGHVLRDEHGCIYEMAGAIADIHDRYLAAQALQATQRRLEHLAYHDELTALHNRRWFNQQMEREHGRARRARQPLSLLLIDIDHFKAYNDHHGHFAGDEVLQEVASMLRASATRAVDVCARIGGEEFAVLLPETPADGALAVAERIRTRLSDSHIPHDAAPLQRVTVSIGATTWDPADRDIDTARLQEEADAALYAAKNGGRDRSLHYRELAVG